MLWIIYGTGEIVCRLAMKNIKLKSQERNCSHPCRGYEWSTDIIELSQSVKKRNNMKEALKQGMPT